MDLKEFISHTVEEILEGVKEARARYPGAVAYADESGDFPITETKIDFEVNVTVNEEGKAGLRVLGIAELGGAIAQRKANTIRFSVPVYLNAHIERYF